MPIQICMYLYINISVKNPPANAGNTRDMGSIPGSGIYPGQGNGNPLQCSCLENSMDRGGWQARVHGLAKSHNWVTDMTEQLTLSLQLKGFFKCKKRKKVMYLIYCYHGYPIWCYPKERMSVQDWSVFICLHSVSLQTLPSTSRYSGGEMWLGLYRNIPEQTCGGSNKLQTSNTHRTETFSEHKQRSVVPNCSYLVLLKNSETWI